jgi:hypothetical protein
MATDFTKFGVPMPGGIRNGMLQPKLSYRFRVIFKGFANDKYTRELTQQVDSCEKPKVKHTEVVLHAYNSIAYAIGKHEWQTIKLVVRDDITNAVSTAVGTQLQRQINMHEQTSSVAAGAVKFSMEIQYLDGTNGDELSSFELDGCFLTDVDFGSSEYKTSDPVTITMTIRYDNAAILRGPGGDGITVGSDPFPNIPSPTGVSGVSTGGKG